jgi:catechol 2,3-dioxygenase-like lactoylglutathione lyase family enzyme
MHVRWMFHATAMVADYDATLEPLARLFGCAVLHDNVVEDEGIGRRGGMTWIGDGSVEIGEPAGTDSPVQKFVDSFGGGMHSVGLQVADIDTAKAHLAAAGVRIVSEPYDGMVWTHPGDTAGVLIEWYALEQDDDPRWGAPVPPAPPALAPVERLAFVTAEVDEPRRAAERLAALSATSWRELDGPGDLQAMVAIGDCSLALLPRVGPRSRVHGIGLLVRSLDDAQRRLAGAGFEGHRTDGLLAVDAPAVPFPVLLCDRLLPGDPRN